MRDPEGGSGKGASFQNAAFARGDVDAGYGPPDPPSTT
jgi:hypothetical protein